MRAKKSLLILLGLLLAGGLIAAAGLLGAQRARAELMAQGQRQLQLMAPDLQSVLQKFETLPFVLGFQPDLIEALAHPIDARAIARLNSTLQTIQQQAKVGAIYVMDRDGMTLGASNWDQPLGFVGKNFSYRPYFHTALRGKAGLFYGIGTSTSEAGYFIAQPVYRDGSKRGAVAGVVAVKISLAEFERTWRSSDDPIVLADSRGVIFLSNRPDWIYHSLGKLDAAAERELASTQQYMGQTVRPLAGHSPYFVTQPVGQLGWQLMLFPGQARVLRVGLLWALAAALLLVCAAVSSWALYQRRRRLEEGLASRVALQRAALELDDKIVERTQQLRLTNQNLEHKYTKLQEAEHLLRSTQDQMVQAGKLAMLGQMAAGVTHELNQPLAAIRAFADNARTYLERDQPAQASANLGHIAAASARMGAIISQLKGFARKDETIAPVDLAASIRASTFLLDSEFRRHDVALTFEATADALQRPLQVTGNTVRIEQVLINLLRNALDAVEDAAERRVAITLARDGDEALVCISDSGAGIPEQVAAHLFEPFFTTKPSGKGLGLGLAISSSIVQAMNGRLSAHNPAGGGARFELRLPLSHQGVIVASHPD
ncbi:sensor histidine kinase [Rugamonas rubra]|uniref:C4-dicarboxylate transport sensor protein DctB n=1 Tax=Rugamonas rubra TaxID=758825 RepID=A0A1I4JSA1_9BURK|nr:ATP-binding protein [Rugamonas rubra]SFL69485.1 two-component system, NtrC family, C4-dicarboxylate transport sensor histidine kinase DctB [Rugamonas rubra]